MEELSLQTNGKFNNNTNENHVPGNDAESLKIIESDIDDTTKYLEQLLNEAQDKGINEAELQLPSWYDPKLFKEGQGYINKYRFYMSIGFFVGFIASLSIPSILKILNCTRQSDTPRRAYRRYVETILHTMSWYNKPLKQDSELWESLMLVRNAHFRSSRSCSKMQAGRITQKDLVLTQFSLIGFFMLGIDRMNINDGHFLEATTYMWRVLGHLLGIDDKYNICASSWRETKPRFEILMERVFRSSLINAEPEFYKTTEILIESLRPVHMVLTTNATLFYIRRLAGCNGYEFLDNDFPTRNRNFNDKLFYYSLGLWDKIVVSSAIFTFTYLYKYNFIRWYLNFYAWLNELLMHYFPYLAIYRYGWDWAYVRIFNKIKHFR